MGLTVPRRLALLLPLLVVGGCATVQDFLDTLNTGRGAASLPLEDRPVEEPGPRNEFVLLSAEQSVIGEPQVVFTRGQDTLPDLAREYGLGFDELVEANPGLSPWLPGDGTPILLPTQYVLPDVQREGVVLNIANKRLFYFPEPLDGAPQRVFTYPIGIGRVGWETPLGSARVIAKATDPAWYVPASVRREHAELGDPLPSVVPPGPDNPLGAHVLKLDMPGYLIHGTNQPYGVGMRVSHGCVRLYPENIELLYSFVDIGEQVMIVNEPYLLGTLDGEVYFEAHTPLEDDAVSSDERLGGLLEKHDASLNRPAKKHIRSVASAASGVPARVYSYDIDEVFDRVQVVRNTVEIDPENPTLEEVRALIDEAVSEADEDQSK